MKFDLLPGQRIMTGSIIPTQFPAANQAYRLHLGDLPPVELTAR